MKTAKTMALTSSLTFLLHFPYVIWLKCRSKSSKHDRKVPVWDCSPYFSAVINYIVKSLKWDFAIDFERPLKCVIVVHSLNVPGATFCTAFLLSWLYNIARGMWLFYFYTSQVVTTTVNAQVLLHPQPAVIHTKPSKPRLHPSLLGSFCWKCQCWFFDSGCKWCSCNMTDMQPHLRLPVMLCMQHIA